MAYDSSDADYSSEAELAAVERWIDPATGKPNYSRFTEHNLEERTLAAVELYRDAHYPNIKNAATALEVPYYREARRKAVEDRATITSWFEAWRKYLNEYKPLKANIWNFDETGFMEGHLKRGSLVWTFNEFDKPVMLDSHNQVSVTAVEAVSATDRSDSFLYHHPRA
ncbi:hypothetical protein E4U51_003836 [Claviceps purpurea]|nr:hypothetical protein E4U51_003836 [Claviceps purpurea]